MQLLTRMTTEDVLLRQRQRRKGEEIKSHGHTPKLVIRHDAATCVYRLDDGVYCYANRAEPTRRARRRKRDNNTKNGREARSQERR